MAQFTPLYLSDSLIGEFSEPFFLQFFKQFPFRRYSLAFQFTNFVDKPKYSYGYLNTFVIGLPDLFHNLVYPTFNNFTLRGMKEFSNGLMDERRRGMKEFSNGLTTMVQQEC